ncbi:hypothetical protein NDU88_001502 [Pleurodeles waltl]|uniref:Uncharacterized protein n=1 Tax=Pleurodeles waltl TaxID=8319 RepID=A0AAV7R8S4_PLEWA|nr:hypothetical protein NDU88_001502 [Pleurodeles waltl]
MYLSLQSFLCCSWPTGAPVCPLPLTFCLVGPATHRLGCRSGLLRGLRLQQCHCAIPPRKPPQPSSPLSGVSPCPGPATSLCRSPGLFRSRLFDLFWHPRLGHRLPGRTGASLLHSHRPRQSCSSTLLSLRLVGGHAPHLQRSSQAHLLHLTSPQGSTAASPIPYRLSGYLRSGLFPPRSFFHSSAEACWPAGRDTICPRGKLKQDCY